MGKIDGRSAGRDGSVMEETRCEGGEGMGGGAGNEENTVLQSPTDAPSAPPPLILCLLLCTVCEQSFGGGWQAISDVMPAVQRWQLNLFSEIPQNFYF